MVTIIAVKQKAEQPKPFPKLMINKNLDLIVFMRSKVGDYGEGFVLQDETCTQVIGYYESRWNIDNFIDFNGEITLKNADV